MNVYINNELIKCEVLPVLNETLDETLDSFSFCLKVNNLESPFAPMQKVKVVFDDETEAFFLHCQR